MKSYYKISGEFDDPPFCAGEFDDAGENCGYAMNVSNPDTQRITQCPAEFVSESVRALCFYEPVKNLLDLTIEYSGAEPPREVTVIFPGVSRTVYIRNVRSALAGEVISFTRPAPRAVTITLPTNGRAAEGSLRLFLEVSSPDLPKAFVTTHPWPLIELCNPTGQQIEESRFDELSKSNLGGGPAAQRARRFFLEFDAATNPFLLVTSAVIKPHEQAVRTALVEKTLGILRKRTDLRGRAAQIAPMAPVPHDSDLKAVRFISEHGNIDAPLLQAEVQYLSSLQRSIIQRHYGLSDAKGVVETDFAAVKEAFDLFADGVLRVRRVEMKHRLSEWNCEPDSAKVFFFAEFALLAIDEGVEVAFWEQMLPIFTGIQPIYTRRYAPPTAKIGFDDYNEGTYQPAVTQSGTNDLVKYDAKNQSHPGATLSAREAAHEMGRNIAESFPGDFEPPSPPTSSGMSSTAA